MERDERNRIVDVKSTPINKLVSHYLMSSYLYYELDVNVYDDFLFNEICSHLADNFDTITHPHKHLLDLTALKASTGFDIIYPCLVKHASVMWYEEVTGYKISEIDLVRAKYNCK